nr:glycoside hydrolase family 43 protein [Allomuricauda sp.]
MDFYKRIILLGILLYGMSICAQKSLEELRIRDPFILPDSITKTYYLYGTTNNRLGEKDSIKGVEVFTSSDLKNWYGPTTVYQHAKDHWGKRMVWAPEVHKYKDKFYLFVTFTGDVMAPQSDRKPPQYKRGTQILWSDSPKGPFLPFENGPTTPNDWMSLDGTLWVENDVPYMIFCHEWAQNTDGTMEVVQLSNDLSKTVGPPSTIFTALEADWVVSLDKVKIMNNKYYGYITDGCFLYRTKTGRLLMIWSSFGENGYKVAQVISETGSVKGPWKHLDQLIFKENGGHGMLFKTFDGKLMMSLHQPNSRPNERPKLFEVEDHGDYLSLKE